MSGSVAGTSTGEIEGLRVIDWDRTQEIQLGSTSAATATLKNTGSTPVEEDIVRWIGDPAGKNAFVAETAALDSGEEATVDFQIEIPPTFVPPGLELFHGWRTDNDLVRTPATVTGPLHHVTDVDAPEQIDGEETASITVTLENAGNAGTEAVDFCLDGEHLETAEIGANPGDVVSRSFVIDGTTHTDGQYKWCIETQWAGDDRMGEKITEEGSIAIGDVSPLPPVVGDDPPQDLNGDGLYRDIQGDGEFRISDVQALFNNLDSDAIQNNPEAFNFSNSDPGTVSIFDVQALFSDLQQSRD